MRADDAVVRPAGTHSCLPGEPYRSATAQAHVLPSGEASLASTCWTQRLDTRSVAVRGGACCSETALLCSARAMCTKHVCVACVVHRTCSCGDRKRRPRFDYQGHLLAFVSHLLDFQRIEPTAGAAYFGGRRRTTLTMVREHSIESEF